MMADLSTLNPDWPGEMWGSDAKETPGAVLSSLGAAALPGCLVATQQGPDTTERPVQVPLP